MLYPAIAHTHYCPHLAYFCLQDRDSDARAGSVMLDAGMRSSIVPLLEGAASVSLANLTLYNLWVC